MSTTEMNVVEGKTFEQRWLQGCDCGPLIETLTANSHYVGLWILQDHAGTFYMLQLDTIKEPCWLEDGATRSGNLTTVYTADKAEAMRLTLATIEANSPIRDEV